MTLGVGPGQTNRVASVRIAIDQAKDRLDGAVLASDAFFPFADNVEEIAKAGIKAIIQPGGSVPVSYTHLDVYKRQCISCQIWWYR